MLGIVRIALRRPYTFVVLALAILIVGPLAALRTPVDIFPDIRIPVIAIIWNYTGLPPDQMAGRIVTQSQRGLTTTVNDIEHIEATSYNGLGIIKIFFQPGVDIRIANAQVTAISQTHDQADAAWRDAAADPQLQRLDGSDHPARAVGLGPLRADARRHRPQRRAHAARHRAGRRDPVSLWRQDAAGADRPRLRRDAGARPFRPGRRQRARGAEPDHAGRLAEDRQLRIRDPAQQRAVRRSPSSATCRSRP